MKTNDKDLTLACLHASIALAQGITGTLSDRALSRRMKRIAEDLIHSVDEYETEHVEEEMIKMTGNRALDNLLRDMENITAYYKNREETYADYADMKRVLDKYYKAIGGE